MVLINFNYKQMNQEVINEVFGEDKIVMENENDNEYGNQNEIH